MKGSLLCLLSLAIMQSCVRNVRKTSKYALVTEYQYNHLKKHDTTPLNLSGVFFHQSPSILFHKLIYLISKRLLNVTFFLLKYVISH